MTFLALDLPAPPALPHGVEESIWRSDAATRVARYGRRILVGYEAAATTWIDSLRRLKTASAALGRAALSPAECNEISNLIDDIETMAELRAIERTKTSRQDEIDLTSMVAGDPAIGAAARDINRGLLETDDRVIEALLDYALFLRAFRAERHRAARGGPVFGPGDDLRDYLERELA